MAAYGMASNSSQQARTNSSLKVESSSLRAKQDHQVLTKLTYQLENQMHEPQVKFLKGYRHPLVELRPMPERFFYVGWDKNRFVVLSHYQKEQNKTDPREIEKALTRLDDWLERKEK